MVLVAAVEIQYHVHRFDLNKLQLLKQIFRWCALEICIKHNYMLLGYVKVQLPTYMGL